jgi:hypothetical protein
MGYSASFTPSVSEVDGLELSGESEAFSVVPHPAKHVESKDAARIKESVFFIFIPQLFRILT